MAAIERLVPVAEPIVTPQCEALRKTPYASDKDGTEYQCKWSSRFIVHGRYLCSKHAAAAALDLLLKEQPND